MHGGRVRQIPVDADGFLIGRGDFCDLVVNDAAVPLAHSELHLQEGAVWIEALDEEVAIEINGKSLRRLALRAGDVLQVGPAEITVRFGAPAAAATVEFAADDLSRLSAAELCDRIEAEEAELAAFERRRLLGWEALLSAVEGVLSKQRLHATHDADPRFETVLQQLQAMSAALDARTRELAAQEVQFVESAAELKDVQERLSRKLDQLLQQAGENELRASA